MKKIKERLIICGLLVLGSLFLCGWTYTLRTNTPAGTDDPTEADDRMREIKGAFVERLDIDHYFTLSATSTYDTADCGKHRFITFREPNDLTVMAADESALFSKNVSTVTELHWIDESDNVLQLTSGGEILFASLSSVANNTYFTAVDAAGTGTVDLIKASASDVATVPDDTANATSGAPTADASLANKKYVDDQDTADHPAYTGGESHTDGSGMITKCGTHTLSGNSGETVSFAVAFPNECVNVQVTQNDTTTVNANCLAYEYLTTGFTIRIPVGGNGRKLAWRAIGY